MHVVHDTSYDTLIVSSLSGSNIKCGMEKKTYQTTFSTKGVVQIDISFHKARTSSENYNPNHETLREKNKTSITKEQSHRGASIKKV
jgi:hypothetical protein